MVIKTNIALSYIAMLSVVGFFLWVIRNFVRGLRRESQLPPVLPMAPSGESDVDKKSVDWPVHLFLSRTDDIPIPGRLISIGPADAFLESSACLKTGQAISLYVHVPDQEPMSLTAKVLWARKGRTGGNAAQLVFDSLCADKRRALFLQAAQG